LNVSHCLAVPSGSIALALSLQALGVSCGDKVIIPDRTWIATTNSLDLLGAIPICVDSHSDISNINESLIEDRISSKTKGIVVVHLNGRSSNIDQISKFIKNTNFSYLKIQLKLFFLHR